MSPADANADPAAIAIIVPVLNEAAGLSEFLGDLCNRHADIELIVVDGGSSDDSVDIARRCSANCGSATRSLILESDIGRARQMNAGAAAATSPILLFLHADTRLPVDAVDRIHAAVGGGAAWGRFDIRFDAAGWIFRIIAYTMNLRSRLTRIATGDQGIFVRRDVFATLGGYADLPLMEDIELCRRLRRRSDPAIIHSAVRTSARHWRQRGIWRTIILMWWLRALFWLGVPAQRLVHFYPRVR